MLPARSKRYAGNDGEIPRLVLAYNWHLGLVAVLILALLVLIFPRNTLVEKLYQQESLDELTLSYIQNLYRADTKNADAAILLTKAQQSELGIAVMELRLLPVLGAGDMRQRTQAWLMLSDAYEAALAAHPNAIERARLTAQWTDMLQKASKEQLTEPLARRFASAAFQLSVPNLGVTFLESIKDGNAFKTLEQYAQEALGEGEYGLASEYFLIARDRASNLDDARRLLQQGIGTLMAGGQFTQAMRAADRHLGNLSDDTTTLRYLARTAQAAGEPAQAARYARRLVFQNEAAPAAP